MADVFSASKRSSVMAAIRSRGNRSTELRLVALLRERRITGWRRGASLPGAPDFVFRPERIAVFVDGCFWHGCPAHCRIPAANRPYWEAKIARNRARDVAVTRELRSRGWRVLRLWEHDLRRPARALARLRRMLRRKDGVPASGASRLENR